MIDIHSHLLPGIDDGSETLDEAIEIARKAFNDGTETIVASPHTLNGLYRNDKNEILREVKNFKQTLKENAILLDVLPGADIALTPELIPCLDAGELMTINNGGRYLLVELQPYYIPEKIHEIIFALKTRGLTPILTHPERDPLIMKNNEILDGFIERGCIAQITAMSLTGGFGKKIKEFSAELVRAGRVHIIASDCHSLNNRPPSLMGAIDVAAKLIGLTNAMKMVDDIPTAVIKGEGIDIPSPLIVNKKRGWPWSRFFAG